MRRGWLLAAIFCLPAALAAQEAPPDAPRVEVTLAPEGPVTVGTALEVTATVLVPSFMPKPPVWPRLAIADAITRVPDRATQPVSRRIGAENWSGVARRWEIIPQRAADYDLGTAGIAITYADPETSQPIAATLQMPALAFSARRPDGAEGMDPFVPASALALAAAVEGLPDAPKPGDAFTLTLTVTASGPPAILLPPLAPGLPTPEGLRAYPKEPALADTPGQRGEPPTATRAEAVTYVIEAPGTYTLPALSLEWWNTATSARETARTEPATVTVPAPPGWHAPGSAGVGERRGAWLIGLALLAVVAALALIAVRRHGEPRPPSEASLYRDLRHTLRAGRPAELRPAVRSWLAAAAPAGGDIPAEVEAALRAIEASAYGTSGAEPPEARTRLLAAVVAERDSLRAMPSTPVLPALNPSTRPIA